MSSGAMCQNFGSLGHLKTNSRPSSTCTLMTLPKDPRSEQETPTSSPQCTNAWPHSRETPSSRHPVVGSSSSDLTNNLCGHTVSSMHSSHERLDVMLTPRQSASAAQAKALGAIMEATSEVPFSLGTSSPTILFSSHGLETRTARRTGQSRGRRTTRRSGRSSRFSMGMSLS